MSEVVINIANLFHSHPPSITFCFISLLHLDLQRVIYVYYIVLESGEIHICVIRDLKHVNLLI